MQKALRSADRMYLHAMRALMLILIMVPTSTGARAQHRHFGSIDDPAEQPSRIAWQSETAVGVYGGFSLIGPQWRSEARLRAEAHTRSLSARLTGVVRSGLYGTYEPDIDEAYDVLRAIDYVRLQSRDGGFYVRAGPLDRTRLGLGHVVNFFSSGASWDERRIGIESSVSTAALTVDVFSERLDLHGLVGANAALTPFEASRYRRLRALTIGIGVVRERAALPEGEPDYGALTLEARMEAWHSGAFSLRPFSSFARTRAGKTGWMLGADLVSDNFIDVARVLFRIGFHKNDAGFLPGHVGPFWQVHGPRARIFRSEDLSPGAGVSELVGIRMKSAPAGEAMTTELRILIFERFELWYRFLRNFASSELSEFNIRLYVRARQFRLAIGQDRGGLGGFFSLFNDLGDLNQLHFEAAYGIRGIAWILVDARYTYIREGQAGDSLRYRVQRRFDPLFGLRFVF